MIQWITSKLGTAPRNDVSENEDVVVVDVRAMVDNIAFTPPLVITEAEIDEMLARFSRAMDDTKQMLDAEKRSVA